MPLPANKTELQRRLQDAHAKLAETAAAVPAEREREPALAGGLSPCDLIAYQIGWGRRLLAWEASEADGGVAEMPAPGYKWNQLGALAQAFYAEHRERTLAQLLAEFEALVGELQSFVAATSEEALFGLGQRRWAGPKWPLVKWIQVNTIAPYGSARAKLRQWQRSLPASAPVDAAERG